jgi:hypothetical protein
MAASALLWFCVSLLNLRINTRSSLGSESHMGVVIGDLLLEDP